MSSPSSIKSLYSPKSNSSARKRQSFTKFPNVTLAKKSNLSKQPNEKQKKIRTMLTFPGNSFILALSDKVDEDKKAYDCVLCYQNSHRTNLQEMIQHCKSKEHMLKVMELVDLKYADFYSKKGTIYEMAEVLKGKTGKLDKNGIWFASFSTFLSVRKKITNRIKKLSKKQTNTPAKTKEDGTKAISNKISTSVQSPKGTYSCSSSAKKEISTCATDVKDSSVKEDKKSQVVLLKRRNSYSNESSIQNPAKKVCIPAKKIDFATNSEAKKETGLKNFKVTTKMNKLNVKIDQIKKQLYTVSKSQSLSKSLTSTPLKSKTSDVKSGSETATKLVSDSRKTEKFVQNTHGIKNQKVIINKSNFLSKSLPLIKQKSDTSSAKTEDETIATKSSGQMKPERATPNVSKIDVKTEDKNKKLKPQSLRKNLVSVKPETVKESATMKLTCEKTTEKKQPQIGKFVQKISDNSQEQMQALKKLQPTSKTLSLTNSESKTPCSKNSVKFFSKSETGKSSGTEEEKQIRKKIVWNEDSNDDDNLDLKNLSDLEKEIYGTYRNQIDELVELQRNRCPNKVIIVTDERDVFTQEEDCINNHQYRIIKNMNLAFDNLNKYLIRDQDFGSGVLYVILCGINSINREKINPACLKTQCTTPCKFLDSTNYDINLIEKAIYVHKLILKFTKNDMVIFSGLLPSSPNYFNNFSYQRRKCSQLHKASQPPQCTTVYDMYKLYLYNTFTKLHSKLLGFSPLNLERGFVVKISDNPVVHFNFATNFRNGYHFTDKFASDRKLAILKKCDKLLNKLTKFKNLEQDKELSKNLHASVKSDIKVGFTNQSEEVPIVQASFQLKKECVEKREEKKCRMNPAIKTVIQSNNFLGKNSPQNQLIYEQPKYESAQAVPLDAITSSVSKYDKIVVLGNSRYKYYLEQLRGPKICIMSDDISSDDLLGYIKGKKTLMPPNTLWILVTGIEFLFCKSVCKICSDFRCSHPLQSAQPTDKVSSLSKALNTFDEIIQALNIIERNVTSALNCRSDFMLFPPIPPAMIIDSSITHIELHKLFLKYPESYIVTNEMAFYFSNIFEKVSMSFTRLTWSALKNMGISVDPLENYLDCQLNQIDFIERSVDSPPSKLKFFNEWSNTFRYIVSSCVGDSNCFDELCEQEHFKSSRIIIFSDNEDEETDSDSITLLYESDKKSSSDVKSDGKSTFSNSSKNKHQCEVFSTNKRGFGKCSQSVTEYKIPAVTAAKRASSQLKDKTTVSEKTSVLCPKPLSKGTNEKFGRDSKSTLSTQKNKLSSCKSNNKKNENDLNSIASDPGCSTFHPSLELYTKPESLIACSKPDTRSEQDIESEILDIHEDEDFSDGDLYNEIFNDSIDNISDTDSSKDPKNLPPNSVEEHLNDSSNDSALNMTAEIGLDLKEKKDQNINILEEKTKQSVGESFNNKQLNSFENFKGGKSDNVDKQDFSKKEKTTVAQEQKLSNYQPIPQTVNMSTLNAPKPSSQIETNNLIVSEQSKVLFLELPEQTLENATSNSRLVSEEVNSTEHQSVCQTLSEKVGVSNLGETNRSLQIDTNNFSLVSVNVNRTEHHSLSEKSYVSNFERTKQSLQIEANNPTSDLIKVGTPSEGKEHKEMCDKCINTNENLETSGNKPGFIETNADSQISTAKTDDNSIGGESKLENSGLVSQEILTDGGNNKSNPKFTKIPSNQSLSDGNQEHREYGPIIFIANDHVNNYLKSVPVFKFKSYSFWDVKFPLNWVQIDENISFLSPNQSYFFVIVADITLVTYDSPLKECFSRNCKWPIIVHHLDYSSDTLLTERLNDIRILHGKLTNIPNINTQAILTPLFPRKYLQFQTIFGFSTHGLLHKVMCNKFKPCFLNGDFEYINNKTIEFKRRWFNFVQGLYLPEDLQKKISSVVFFDLHYSYSPVNWTHISELDFPFIFRKFWTEKLIIVIDYYIQTYLVVPKTTGIIANPDPKPLNLNADSEGNASNRGVVEDNIRDDKIEDGNINDLSSKSNENNEEFEAEKMELNGEELLIIEELEREILEADDDELEEDKGFESDSVFENKSLNDDNDGELNALLTANKSEGLETISEDLKRGKKNAKENIIAEVNDITNLLSNVNSTQNVNINEIGLIEIIKTKESEKENEYSGIANSAEDLSNQQNFSLCGNKIAQIIGNTNDIDVFKITTKESMNNEKLTAAFDSSVCLNNEQKTDAPGNKTIEVIDDTNIVCRNVNLSKKANEIVEIEESDKKDESAVAIENTSNDKSKKLDSTNSATEYVEKKDDNGLKNNYSESELMISENQDDCNNVVAISKSCMDVNARSFSDEFKNEKSLVDFKEHVNKQDQSSDGSEMKNSRNKTPCKINSTREENNKNEKNSCEAIFKVNENFESKQKQNENELLDCEASDNHSHRQISNNINFDVTNFGSGNYEMVNKKGNLDKTLCSDLSLNEGLSDKLSQDGMLSSSPEEIFSCRREDKTDDTKLGTIMQSDKQDPPRWSDINIISINDDNDKILDNQISITFVGTENGEIFICHNHFSYKYSNEDKFSHKVQINIPTSKEPCNYEIKGQNEVGCHCQKNYEKVNETEKTVESFTKKETNNILHNVGTEECVKIQSLKLDYKESNAKNKLQNPKNIIELQPTLNQNDEDCMTSQHLELNGKENAIVNNADKLQNLNTEEPHPTLIKINEDVTSQPLELKGKGSLEKIQDDTLSDVAYEKIEWESSCNENIKEIKENENGLSPIVEVIQRDSTQSSDNLVLKSLEASSDILSLEEDIYKSRKIEENSTSSCNGDKSDLNEDFQKQLLIEEELEAEIFDDDDDDYSYDDDNGSRTRDTLEDDKENLSESLNSPEITEPSKNNTPTSETVCPNPSKEEKLYIGNSDTTMECIHQHVKEAALEIDNGSKGKENLESCESDTVPKNDTKIYVNEMRESDNKIKETPKATACDISEYNFSYDGTPEDKVFAENDSSQVLAHVTTDNDFRMEKSFGNTEDLKNRCVLKMDSFDNDFHKESDTIFDMDDALVPHSRNEMSKDVEDESINNNEQHMQNLKNESKANHCEDVGVAEKDFKTEVTSKVQSDISESSKKIMQKSGEKTAENSNIIKFKLNESVDNSGQTIEMNESSKDNSKGEIQNLTIDHIEIVDDPKVMKLISDDQKNNEANFSRHVEHEKLLVRDNFKTDEDVSVNQVNPVTSIVKDKGGDNPDKGKMKMQDDSLKKIIFKNIENKMVGDLEKNGKMNLIRTDMIKGASSDTNFDQVRSVMEDDLENKDDHPVVHLVKDDLTHQFKITEYSKNPDNPTGCSKEVEQCSDNTNIQSVSLQEISKNKILYVQEDLDEKIDSHLTVFDVEENILKNEVGLQQYVDNCKLKNSQSPSISNENFEVNVKRDVSKNEATVESNHKEINNIQSVKGADIEDLCDIQIEKSKLKGSTITGFDNVSILNTSTNKDFRKDEADIPVDADEKNLVNEDKVSVDKDNDPGKKNFVSEVINKKREFDDLGDFNKMLGRNSSKNLSCSASELVSTSVGVIDPPKTSAEESREIYANKLEESTCNEAKKPLDTTLKHIPVKGKKLKVQDVDEFDAKDEEKEENTHHSVLKTTHTTVHDTEKGNLNESIVIQPNSDSTLNIPYSNMNDKVKCDNLVIKNSAEKLNDNGSDKIKMAADRVNLSTTINSLNLHETTKINEDLENCSGSFESNFNKDSFSHLKKSAILDSDSYKQSLAVVDKTISYSTNLSMINQLSPRNSDSLTNSNMNTVVEFNSDKKEQLNQSICSANDNFHSASNAESSGTDIEIESNEKIDVMHEMPVNLDIDHSSNFNIETESGKKSAESNKIATKSTVGDSSKIESEIENSQTADQLNETTAKSVEKLSSKCEIEAKGEKEEASYKLKKLEKERENQINKPIPLIDLSDSEEEKEDSSNGNSEKKMTSLELNKVQNIIPYYEDRMFSQYDHIYIIGQFNPLFKKNRKNLNFTFINKSMSDLNEDNVVDLLEEKSQIVTNSVCIFVCNILDITRKCFETKSNTNVSPEFDFNIYELKESSSDPTEEGKLFITESITTFIKTVDSLRNKLPVVVMPLQPYMLITRVNIASNETGANDSSLFVHGTTYKWTHYRDYFVNSWMRVLDTNDKDINKSYIESFVTKPAYVYPIIKAESKGIGINSRKLEWAVKVNDVILKLVKKSMESILKEDYTTAGCSKDKLCESEKCEIKVTNLSESVPNQFFEEMSKKTAKKAVCRFEQDYVEITFYSHLKGHLFANFLDHLAIGDTVLYATCLEKGCINDISKLSLNTRKDFRERLRPHLEFWELSASEIAKTKIQHTLSCESFKTIKCEKADCDESKCIFYHSDKDKRRNPFSFPYGSALCKQISANITCAKGENCNFAHNNFEIMFHPYKMYFRLCQDYKTRKECFAVNPLCLHGHLDSPETFFTRHWNNSLLFGTPLAVEFLAGAIAKFNLYTPSFKDARIFMMGASTKFLHNVWKTVSPLCRIRGLKSEFIGERGKVMEVERLLFGRPSKFLKSIDHLVLLPFTLIIVSQVDVLLSIKKERKALKSFISQCQMPYLPPYVQVLFVADEYDAELHGVINHHLFQNVKVINNPEHKVKFEYDVPCDPFALKPLPKFLNTGSNPTRVFPFLSGKIAQILQKEEKEDVSNTPWFKKEKFCSSDSEFSLDSSSSDAEEEKRRSSRKGRKRKPSRSSQYRSPSPNHKRYRSRSPSRRPSTSQCSSRKSVKRPLSRQSHSPTSRSDKVPYGRSSSSSASPERLPLKQNSVPDANHNKDSCNYLSTKRKSTVRDIQSRSSGSPPKKRTNLCDVKLLDNKLSSSAHLTTTPPPPPPPPSMAMDKSKEREKKEPMKPDISMDRIIHRSILLESAIQGFNTASLREELGENLYEEFEAAREKTCFKLEEEFNVYKTVPELYEKYEECFEGFMQMYRAKYPNHSEEHRVSLWKEFWKAKFDFIEKTELRNRMVTVIGKFRQKIQSVPPPPPPPKISGMDSRIDQSKSENKMMSTSHVPMTSHAQTDNLKNIQSNKSAWSYMSPSSNVKHINYPATGKVDNREIPFPPPPPPPPPIISDSPIQSTFGKVYHSNETSGLQTHLPATSSLSERSNTDLYSKTSEENLDNRFQSVKSPLVLESDDKSAPGINQQQTLLRNLLEKFLSPSDFKEVDKIVCKSSSLSAKGSSVDSFKKETPPIEQAQSSMNSVSLESLPSHILALAKRFSSDFDNKTLNESSYIAPIPSNSINMTSVTSGNRPTNIDNQIMGNNPVASSVLTSSRNKESMMKDIKQSKVSEGENSFENFNVDKAIADLGLVVPELGVLGSSINALLSISKENGINSEKSFRNFADPDNVTLLELALTKMKVKCKESRKDFYSSLEGSVNGLIKFAKEQLEKKEKKELPLNYEAIAKATIGKDPPSILKMIRAAALYEDIQLTKQEENETYMKVCEIHFNLASS